MSFNKQLHSIWKFQKEDERYIKVHMYLWAKGLCITGHNGKGELVAGHAYAYDRVYELRTLENIILSEPLLADPGMVEKVFMSVSRHVMYPQQLAWTRKDADDWLQRLHYIEFDEDIATAHDNTLGVDVVFPKKKTVRSILSQYFPERQSKFYIAPVHLLSDGETDVVMITLFEKQCTVTVYAHSQLQHHSVFEWMSVEDILIQIHTINEALQLDTEHQVYSLMGVCKDMTQVDETFKSYYSTDIYQKIEPEQFFKALSICE